MKRIILMLIIISSFFDHYGQSHLYYYYKGNPVAVPIHNNDCLLFIDSGTSLDEISSAGFGVEDIFNMPDSSIQCVKISGSSKRHIERSTLLNFLHGIRAIEPIIGYENDTNEIFVSNHFYVKLKQLSDTIKLRELARQYNVEIVGSVPYCELWYTLSTMRNSLNSIACSNIFYESGDFQDIDPGFIFNFHPNCVTDDYFTTAQLGLHSYDFGINACEAWNITSGFPKIKIALIDGGISTTHQEFDHLNIIASYNAVTQTPDAACYYAHGTYTGGVIFADHNENFIAGVSPECSLLNVCVPLQPNHISRFASCINWAVQNKADVINCSWGDHTGLYYDLMHSSLLEEAIDNALDNGRNGKGCVVIFAAGNNDTIQTIIDYPAYYRPENLTIGASNSLGYRSPWSVYGSELDFVAPGYLIYTTAPNHCYEYVSGTSLSAPHVAGVAALVLSVNPCLTREEVTYILESTCTKVRSDLYSYGNNTDHPNGTWNIEVGHGLVNAYEAVLLAQQMGGYVFRNQTEIQSNTLWDTASLINADLVIDSLATLTITDTLYIAGGHNIIVRPGGKLIVNGGTLTNACDGEMWNENFSLQPTICQYFHYLCTRERDERMKG